MTKRTPLIIAAIAVMLAATTAAYGYGETWTGMHSSGTITYNGNPYTYSGSGGSVNDTTGDGDTLDWFYVNTYPAIPFTYSTDVIYLYVSTFGGYKPTGQSGTKYGYGTWSGSCYIQSAAQWVTVSGTWTGTFYYSNLTFRGGWNITLASPNVLTGAGASAGSRTASW